MPAHRSTYGRGVKSVHWPLIGRVLLVLAMVILAFVSLLHGTALLKGWGLGWDAHAYYIAWDGPLYDLAPGYRGAYNYSPVFAQVLWPLTLAPWAVVRWVFVLAAAAGIVWLCRPLSPLMLGLTLAICATQILSGNIDWLVAVLLVCGLGTGPAWVPVALTKVTSCLGPLWFLARAEWRPLFRFFIGLALVVGLSFALSPSLWMAWVDFMVNNADSGPGMFTEVLPPLPVRLLLAVAITVYAARIDQSWLLPLAMLLAAPVPGTGPWALLAAIPRLRVRDKEARARRSTAVHTEIEGASSTT